MTATKLSATKVTIPLFMPLSVTECPYCERVKWSHLHLEPDLPVPMVEVTVELTTRLGQKDLERLADIAADAVAKALK